VICKKASLPFLLGSWLASLKKLASFLKVASENGALINEQPIKVLT
jgi:hypothetical protein